jgi:hypothetical protein
MNGSALRPAHIFLVLLGSLGFGGCAVGPNPVIARDPIPPPSPKFRVDCANIPLIRHHHFTVCTPADAEGYEAIRVAG